MLHKSTSFNLILKIDLSCIDYQMSLNPVLYPKVKAFPTPYLQSKYLYLHYKSLTLNNHYHIKVSLANNNSSKL